MQLMGLGLVLGGGARAAVGARNLVHDTQTPISSTFSPEPIQVVRNDSDVDREKQSAEGAAAAPPWWDPIAQAAIPNVSTKQPLGDWWGPAAGIGLAGGGLLGGWALTDWLLSKERQQANDADVDAAEQEYEKALAEQYRQAMRAKAGSDTFGLDALYDKMTEAGDTAVEKSAFVQTLFDKLYSPFGHDNVQMGKGALLAAMALMAGGTGLATYNYTKGRNRQEIMQKALQRRARQRMNASPAPLYSTAPYATEPEDEETEELQYAA